MDLGVRRGTVKIVPYQEGWKAVFLLEKKLLQSIFGQYALAIEHIGSTDIEGLQAKPIIDIAIQVTDIKIIKDYEVKLKIIGYKERVNRLEGLQRVFTKENNTFVTHHLHLIQSDYPEWNRKLLFRNYLRTHLDTMQEYEALKVRLIRLFQVFGSMGGTYNELKKDFISSVVEKAEKEENQGI